MSDAPALFLSKLALNPVSGEVRRGLDNSHALHHLVMRGFQIIDSATPRHDLAVLYRPELDARTGALSLVVQSALEPDWSPLREGGWQAALLIDDDAARVKRIDGVYGRLGAGDRLRFRLRANPTRRLIATLSDGSPNQGGGKRVQLYREEEQLAWLARKAAAGSFQIEAATARPDRLGGNRQIGWRGARERGRELVHEAVLFDGELTVVDADLFRAALAAGIGSGKAYGFGLLSVATAP